MSEQTFKLKRFVCKSILLEFLGSRNFLPEIPRKQCNDNTSINFVGKLIVWHIPSVLVIQSFMIIDHSNLKLRVINELCFVTVYIHCNWNVSHMMIDKRQTYFLLL